MLHLTASMVPEITLKSLIRQFRKRTVLQNEYEHGQMTTTFGTLIPILIIALDRLR
jgi:hypothetical protein